MRHLWEINCSLGTSSRNPAQRLVDQIGNLDRVGRQPGSRVACPSASKARPAGSNSPSRFFKTTSPSITLDVPMSQITGVVVDGNPNAIGWVLNRPSVPPCGATFCPPLPAIIPAKPAFVTRSR